MKYLFFLFCGCALLITNNAYCQTGYKPGYILTLSNDTVRGEIYYHSGRKDFRECRFRLSAKERPTYYYPNEIKGYRLNEGKFFISKRIPVYTDTLLLFVEYMMQGQASFYYLSFNHQDHFYVEAHGELKELSELQKTAVINDKLVIKPPSYYGILHYLMADSPEVSPEIDKLTLSYESLLKLGRDYHESTCKTRDCIVFQQNVKKISISIAPEAGFAFSSINFGGNIRDDHVDGSFAGITARVSYIIPNYEKLTLNVGGYINYCKALNLIGRDALVHYNGITYHINNEIEEVYGPTNIYTKNLRANLNLVIFKLPATVDFRFGTGRFHYTAGAGCVTYFTISQNKEFDYPYFKVDYGKSFPAFLIGGTAKATIEYGKRHLIEGGVSYDSASSLQPNETTRLKYRALSLNMGFRF